MKTAIIIVAHAPLASAYCEVASHILSSEQHEQLICLDIEADADVEQAVTAGIDLLQPVAIEQGALVLTDCFGATPSNIAKRIADSNPQNALVTGINLPMLIRVLNYQQEKAPALANIALDGGKAAIIKPQAD
jgi:PTS system mannose-specific IIA component